MSKGLVVRKVWYYAGEQADVDTAIRMARKYAGDVRFDFTQETTGRWFRRTSVRITVTALTRRGEFVTHAVAEQLGQL
jgi:hypothetical protein